MNAHPSKCILFTIRASNFIKTWEFSDQIAYSLHLLEEIIVSHFFSICSMLFTRLRKSIAVGWATGIPPSLLFIFS